MKVLITGGAGFIGSHVADLYIEHGHQVVIVDDLSTGKMENVNRRAKFYHLDIQDKRLNEIFEKEKPDIVNHHAAQISVPHSVENPKKDAEINILGLLNLINVSSNHNIRKIIYISSGGAIYGETDEIPTSENHKIQPESPYGISKMVGEHYLHFASNHYGLDFTVLRYANVFGPRQSVIHEAGVVAIFVNNLITETVSKIFCYPGQPEGNTRDYVYVRDVAHANLLALDKGSRESFNIATSLETSTSTLYHTISKIMDKCISPDYAQARKGDLHRSCLNISKIKEHLGWQPRYSLEKGLAETVSYIQKKSQSQKIREDL